MELEFSVWYDFVYSRVGKCVVFYFPWWTLSEEGEHVFLSRLYFISFTVWFSSFSFFLSRAFFYLYKTIDKEKEEYVLMVTHKED